METPQDWFRHNSWLWFYEKQHVATYVPRDTYLCTKPLAVKGLISYRYIGRYGYVMIGARSHAEALDQAGLSVDGPVINTLLQVFNGTIYVPAYPVGEPAAPQHAAEQMVEARKPPQPQRRGKDQDMNNETIVKALEAMTAALQAQLVAEHPTTPTKFAFELGRKYARVFRTDCIGRDVYAFVDMQSGDILKPASWKGPSKNVRANIFAADYMKACGVYGVARSRR